MKADKALIEYAKKLVEISMIEGRVSEERVAAVLKTLSENPPRQYATVLKYYYRYIQKAVRQSQAIVEHAGALSMSAMTDLQESLTEHYDRDITIITEERPELIAGVRVQVGDDVYDRTVAGRLAALKVATA